MKLIFLDIDGVLNHELWFKERFNSLKKSHGDEKFFDPKSVGLLNFILSETDAKIVVSSSWRLGRSVDDLKEIFSKVGVDPSLIIDKTPMLSFQDLKINNQEYHYSVPRGCEIKAWMECNKNILGDKISKVRYIILDDDSDMLFWQRNNYLQVDSYCGLTYNLAHKAIQILNR